MEWAQVGWNKLYSSLEKVGMEYRQLLLVKDLVVWCCQDCWLDTLNNETNFWVLRHEANAKHIADDLDPMYWSCQPNLWVLKHEANANHIADDHDLMY